MHVTQRKTMFCLSLIFGMICYEKLCAETFYKTGFEASAEEFGNFKDTAVNTQNGWKGSGKIVHGTFRSDSQLLTPGPGSGLYGACCIMRLEKTIKTDTIWVDMSVNLAADAPLGAWVWLLGTNAGTSTNILSTYLAFYKTGITAHSYNVESGARKNEEIAVMMEPGTWYRLTIAFHCKKHTYDVYINGELKKGDIVFFGHKDYGYAENLSEVRLGGGASKVSLAYYDDLYIGDASPLK